jgi:hypothetical protein
MKLGFGNFFEKIVPKNEEKEKQNMERQRQEWVRSLKEGERGLENAPTELNDGWYALELAKAAT